MSKENPVVVTTLKIRHPIIAKLVWVNMRTSDGLEVGLREESCIAMWVGRMYDWLEDGEKVNVEYDPKSDMADLNFEACMMTIRITGEIAFNLTTLGNRGLLVISKTKEEE